LGLESKYKERRPRVQEGIMKAMRFVLMTGVVLLLLSLPAMAQTTEIRAVTGGTSNPDSGQDISSAVGSSWNVPPYDCTSGLAGEQETSTFVVTKTTPPCLSKQYSTDFTVSDPINGDFGVTMQVGCDTGSDKLTSWVAVCDGSSVKCGCEGANFQLGTCAIGSDDGDPGSCTGTCTLAGTCGGGNTCSGDPGRSCFTDADCRFCGNNESVLCNLNSDCEFGDCGPLRGFCSDNDAIACNPPSVPGPKGCTGTCFPAACGGLIAGRCNDAPNKSCTSNADCGRCANAPLEPCLSDVDCDFGTCEEGLTNTDNFSASDFFGIVVRRTPQDPPDPPTQLTLLDPLRTGLLIAGLLSVGIVLLLRRARTT